MAEYRNLLIWLVKNTYLADKISNISNNIGSIESLTQMNFEELSELGFFNNTQIESLLHSDIDQEIEDYIISLDKLGINIVTFIDKTYPKDLLEIIDFPPVLFVRGEIIPSDHFSIGIVGSRKSTAYGRWACEKFSRELSQLGITIVSGMALGIDSYAHKAAIETKGRTIAVLGNGIDLAYPKRNKDLYDIIPEFGAVVSEFSPGTQPSAYNFPKRNRIISGLSLGTIVIEAQVKSGSLITASHAAAQGKEVFAVPGNINSLYSSGTNHLIKDGAKPICSIDDVLEEIIQLKALKNSLTFEKLEQTSIPLSELERKVLNYLVEGPQHTDIIAIKSGIDVTTVISTLTILELKGIVKELNSRTFIMC